jgi:hypothetical protein
MVHEANRCPKCLIGMFSLRAERKHFGFQNDPMEMSSKLSQVAISRTYVCKSCGYVTIRLEPIPSAASLISSP